MHIDQTSFNRSLVVDWSFEKNMVDVKILSIGYPYLLDSINRLVLFVCLVALRPKSTAMVIAGRSVHLTTLFSSASLNKQLTSTSCTYFRL